LGDARSLLLGAAARGRALAHFLEVARVGHTHRNLASSGLAAGGRLGHRARYWDGDRRLLNLDRRAGCRNRVEDRNGDLNRRLRLERHLRLGRVLRNRRWRRDSTKESEVEIGTGLVEDLPLGDRSSSGTEHSIRRLRLGLVDDGSDRRPHHLTRRLGLEADLRRAGLDGGDGRRLLKRRRHRLVRHVDRLRLRLVRAPAAVGRSGVPRQLLAGARLGVGRALAGLLNGGLVGLAAGDGARRLLARVRLAGRARRARRCHGLAVVGTQAVLDHGPRRPTDLEARGARCDGLSLAAGVAARGAWARRSALAEECRAIGHGAGLSRLQARIVGAGESAVGPLRRQARDLLPRPNVRNIGVALVRVREADARQRLDALR